MFDLFYKVSGHLVNFSTREKVIIEQAFTFRQVPKKFKLAEEGKIARELYFISKGLLRLYYTKDGEEITAFLFKEGLFAGSYDSFLRQTPSIQTLETLEECDLLVISFQQLEELYVTVPKVNILSRKIAEQRFINGQQIFSSFILDTPEERYRKFLQQHGDLLHRVPQHMIASYLGVTPVSLSRIRRRVSA